MEYPIIFNVARSFVCIIRVIIFSMAQSPGYLFLFLFHGLKINDEGGYHFGGGVEFFGTFNYFIFVHRHKQGVVSLLDPFQHGPSTVVINQNLKHILFW